MSRLLKVSSLNLCATVSCLSLRFLGLLQRRVALYILLSQDGFYAFIVIPSHEDFIIRFPLFQISEKEEDIGSWL